MTAPAAGLVEMKVLMCLGVVLICLADASTWLPRALDKAAAFFYCASSTAAWKGATTRSLGLPRSRALPQHRRLFPLSAAAQGELPFGFV